MVRASLGGLQATGRDAGRPVPRIRTIGGREVPLPPRCASCDGYNLHAGVSLKAGQREQLDAVPLPSSPSATWTWEGLRRRFGSATVEVSVGRDRHERPDMQYGVTAARMRFDAFLNRVCAEGESNDVYLVPHNRAFEEPLLASMRDDLRFPVVPCATRRLNLWLGPRGTRTPLHHDRADILFVQILGRKRFYLADGMDLRLLLDCLPFWVDHNLASPPNGAGVHELVLEPGDALLLPCGT